MAQVVGQTKLHPKLRMIGNGDEVVNCLRAEQSQNLVSTAPLDTLFTDTKLATVAATTGFLPLGLDTADFSTSAAPAARKKLTPANRASHAYVGVFIEVHRDRQVAGPAGTASDVESVKDKIAKSLAPVTEIDRCVLSKRNFIAATVRVSDLPALAADERVAFIHPAEALALDVPRPRRGVDKLKPTDRSVAGKHNGGAGVIIGIIDVGGYDFSHRDFIANGKSRFLSIWDQGGKRRSPPSKRSGADFAPFDFGSEILQADLDKALAVERAGGLAATALEPQSQQSRSSHATHVTSIAAGNSGVCPKADIAAVLLNVPFDPEDLKARRETFSDSTRLVLAIEYLLEIAKREDKPISINISLGTNGGAHDGSGGVSRWFDALLATEGRSITIAAGNAGQEAATEENPNGWMMGRIHASGRIAARGLVVDLDWTVVGDQIVDLSENELELWHSPQDRIRIAVRPPGSNSWIEVGPRQYIENKRLASGTFLSVYNELYNPVNGANCCAVYLSPDLRPGSLTGVAAGTWTIRLIGEEVRNGEFHCWIERDDPYRYGPGVGGQLMRMPSFFSAASNVDSHSINSLACGHRVIAVANLDDRRQRIAATSSQGPTRDARMKPDIAAPGTGIVAANGLLKTTNPGSR
ncbi:Subtilase family protein [Mesorhizobium albiziae]|uniref:Subtilase family protein n=1 Tax=Neomesorhizobium albiziae TaxID=335020 RepID=A0A1I4EK45_9HYPH|nr:S8 family serine peptidase [Mesorhizobium albiziae]GLS34394.1 hypothetical protein GCM10007937_61090 [Mesorhizobium albiziae]SFL06085.1 Subtilase family protein [Mesorhizobium albiziae]